MSWQTADFLCADTTDVLAVDTTDVLPANTTRVLPAGDPGLMWKDQQKLQPKSWDWNSNVGPILKNKTHIEMLIHFRSILDQLLLILLQALNYHRIFVIEP